MRRAQSVRSSARPSLALGTDELGALREGDESNEDVLRRQLLDKDRENDKVRFLLFPDGDCFRTADWRGIRSVEDDDPDLAKSAGSTSTTGNHARNAEGIQEFGVAFTGDAEGEREVHVRTRKASRHIFGCKVAFAESLS
jgi:hypothetical protein